MVGWRPSDDPQPTYPACAFSAMPLIGSRIPDLGRQRRPAHGHAGGAHQARKRSTDLADTRTNGMRGKRLYAEFGAFPSRARQSCIAAQPPRRRIVEACGWRALSRRQRIGSSGCTPCLRFPRDTVWRFRCRLLSRRQHSAESPVTPATAPPACRRGDRFSTHSAARSLSANHGASEYRLPDVAA